MAQSLEFPFPAGTRHRPRKFRLERPLVHTSIWACAVLGLVFGLTRCILMVRENLQSSASNLGATLFLATMIGGVALLITLFAAAVGFVIGMLLQTGYDWWRSRKGLPNT